MWIFGIYWCNTPEHKFSLILRNSVNFQDHLILIAQDMSRVWRRGTLMKKTFCAKYDLLDFCVKKIIADIITLCYDPPVMIYTVYCTQYKMYWCSNPLVTPKSRSQEFAIPPNLAYLVCIVLSGSWEQRKSARTCILVYLCILCTCAFVVYVIADLSIQQRYSCNI